ncbi:hypothetical protein [Streptomyces sp. NPDC002104]
METATSQVIGQLSGYMRGLTQRLDPGAGWYGEFLRRDPQGMRACLDGAAMPPWDVLESLLGDLAASTGAAALEREARYAAGLRAAAVGVWDRLPGGVEELHTLLASAAEQRARARDALRVLSARLAETADPAQAQALSRELSWTRDDAARAAARHDDLTTRLEAVAPGPSAGPPAPEPLTGVPAQRTAAWPGPRDAGWPGAPTAEAPGRAPGTASDEASRWSPGSASGRGPGTPSDVASGRAPGMPSGEAAAPTADPVPDGAAEPVGRAEGRWLRGARRSGGARYAGAAAPDAGAVTVPPGQPSSATPLRGARFGRPARPEAEPSPAGHPAAPAGPARGTLREPARAGSEGPSAAAGDADHAGSGPTAGHAGAAPTADGAWPPAEGRPHGAPGPTGQGTRPPTAPAWSAGRAPAPASAPAPGWAPASGGPSLPGGDSAWGRGARSGEAPVPDRAPVPGGDSASGGAPVPGAASASGPDPRPHPQGQRAPWPDRAPDGSAHWAAPTPGAGPQGVSPAWDGSASADGPQGASAPWRAPASAADSDGASAPSGGPQGASAQWHAPAAGLHGGSAPGGGPQGASVQWHAPAAGLHGGSAAGGGSHGAPGQWRAPASAADSDGASAPGSAPQGPAPWARGPRGLVEGLIALRSQGRSGEAHVLLCEAAAGPAGELVVLGEELGRAGLVADWATLLWEAASLPPARFAAAAAALGPADREALLRQGAARPAAEIAEAALVLAAADHAEEADALLAAFVRVRTAEESARLARRDPRWFAPRLLRAAEALSGAHHRDLLHALRVANLPVG